MLKTEQILNAKFTPVSKGTYNAEEVDAFLRVVAQSYDSLTNEKNELIKKISILADKIESYRSDEEAIKLSLLDAHRMAETINKNASIKSENLIGDAETRAQLIVDGANRQASKTIDEAKEQAKEIVENAKTAVASLTERAQKETDAAISAANSKAAVIVSYAEKEAEKIIGSSKESYEFYTAELARLQATSADFKAAMIEMCNNQLNLMNSVPETFVIPVIEETEDEAVVEEAVVAEEVEQEIPDAEIAVETEDIFAKLDDEIAAIDTAEEPAEALDSEEQEEIADDVSDETDSVEDYSAETDFEEDDDDIFSLIDDIDLDDIVTDSIPESLDDLVVSAPADNETEEVTEDEIMQDVPDEESFEGFKIDLDSLGLDDDKDDDDDITSLFDSMFDD